MKKFVHCMKFNEKPFKNIQIVFVGPEYAMRKLNERFPDENDVLTLSNLYRYMVGKECLAFAYSKNVFDLFSNIRALKTNITLARLKLYYSERMAYEDGINGVTMVPLLNNI